MLTEYACLKHNVDYIQLLKTFEVLYNDDKRSVNYYDI